MASTVAAALAAGVLFSGCTGGDIEKTGLVKLSKHCYAYIASGPTTAEGHGVNSGFVVGDDGVLVVDSRFTPALSRQLLKAIRSVTDRPIEFLVDTSYLPDHTWGNATFKKAGAKIIARRETAESIARYSPVYKEYYKQFNSDAYELIKDVDIVLPDSFLDDEMKLDLGGVTVVLRYPGPACTAGDCIVSVPRERVVYAGEILSNGYHPNLGDSGADYDNWVEVLGELSKSGAKRFVPGRGHVCGKKTITANVNYIRTLVEACKESIAAGKPIDDAKHTILMPEYADYLQSNLLPFNIQAVYRKSALGIVRPPFRFELPEGYMLYDGAGGTKAGMLEWGIDDASGYRELKVEWRPTLIKEVIVQDVRDAVARLNNGSEPYDFRVNGSGKITVAGSKAPKLMGRWVYKRAANLQGGGRWVWTIFLGNGRIYSVRALTDARMDREKEKRNIEELERAIAGFKPLPEK